MLNRRAAEVGLGGWFAGHSLRSGFATEGYAWGATEFAIMRHARWRSTSGGSSSHGSTRYCPTWRITFRRGGQACWVRLRRDSGELPAEEQPRRGMERASDRL
jgi:hypothetical protein